MKKLILSCKRATYLISLKEEAKLSFVQQLQLRTHLAVCNLCKLFEKQTAFLTRNAARQLPANEPYLLNKEAKAKMAVKLERIISEKPGN